MLLRLPGRRASVLPALLVILALSPLSPFCPGADAAERILRTVDGEAVPAKLSAAEDAWDWTFATDDGPVKLDAAGVVRFGAPPEPSRETTLVLADGGFLVGEVRRGDHERVLVAGGFGEVEIPLERLAGIVYRPPVAVARRDRLFDRVLFAEDAGDRVLLTNEDTIAGTIAAVGPTTVEVQAALGPLSIETHRIRAVVYNPALLRRPGQDRLGAWVGLDDGSRLRAQGLRIARGTCEITLAGGLTVEGDAASIVFLQPIGGRAVYLSDRAHAGYRHVPYLDLEMPFARDRTVEGGWLRGGGRLFLKGLAMHSAARLTYPLDGAFEAFEAEIGIDGTTGGRGSVVFRVYVDGRPAYASEIVRGGEPPHPVRVALADAERLDLIVDFADHGPVLDRAAWFDARLIAAPAEAP